MIRPYLRYILSDYKTQRERKTQLTIITNFKSSKDSDEIRTMNTKSNNIEIIMGNKTVVEELFESLLQKYQEVLEEKMRGSKFVFESIDLLHYKLHKISLKRRESYINPQNNDDKGFQYAITAGLNYEQIKSHAERLSNIKLFIDQYNWKEIDFSSHKNNRKMFELNNKSIAVNVLYLPCNTESIKHAYKSKYNKEWENQVILLKITILQ